ncbi:hypothetical protein DDT91_03505 [Algoriphagus sp. AK58]|nr:hypothetical protein [Algoriphagus sp. AK58]
MFNVFGFEDQSVKNNGFKLFFCFYQNSFPPFPNGLIKHKKILPHGRQDLEGRVKFYRLSKK